MSNIRINKMNVAHMGNGDAIVHLETNKKTPTQSFSDNFVTREPI